MKTVNFIVYLFVLFGCEQLFSNNNENSFSYLSEYMKDTIYLVFSPVDDKYNNPRLFLKYVSENIDTSIFIANISNTSGRDAPISKIVRTNKNYFLVFVVNNYVHMGTASDNLHVFIFNCNNYKIKKVLTEYEFCTNYNSFALDEREMDTIPILNNYALGVFHDEFSEAPGIFIIDKLKKQIKVSKEILITNDTVFYKFSPDSLYFRIERLNNSKIESYNLIESSY